MPKIIVTAPKGFLDQLIIQEAAKNKQFEIIGAIGPKGRDYIGQDVGIVAGLGAPIGALVYDDLQQIIAKTDVIIDFSTVELSMQVLQAAKEAGVAILCGTTGFSSEQKTKFVEASKYIPVLHAANTSYVVNVMNSLLKQAAKALQDISQVDIIDMHSCTKIDSPSGTAKELAQSISDNSTIQLTESNFHSIRSGNIPSSHTVLFGCMGERLEITHHAYDWQCYAKGACEAAIFLAQQAKGLYSMEDVINNSK